MTNLCPYGYININCLHKSAGWFPTTSQNHSAKNKIDISGGTGKTISKNTPALILFAIKNKIVEI